MFGRAWTTEHWVGVVTARVQEPGESVLVYSLSKLRLHRKCPFKLTERESIRYLTMGIRDVAYRAVILGSRCATVMDYLTLVWEVGELPSVGVTDSFFATSGTAPRVFSRMLRPHLWTCLLLRGARRGQRPSALCCSASSRLDGSTRRVVFLGGRGTPARPF